MGADSLTKEASYAAVRSRIEALLANGEGVDWIGAMATVACELHHAFSYYHWTGFYRVVGEGMLMVGPYQGGHGCLEIPFTRGVCGAAARTRATQRIADVNAVDDHIACSSTTQSEIVVPVITPEDRLIAVLDVDSDNLAAFDEVDQKHLELLCAQLGKLYPSLFKAIEPTTL